MLTLHPPFHIGPRLAPALRIDTLHGPAWLNLIGTQPTEEKRVRACMALDLPCGRTCHDHSMQSGVGGFRGLVEVFETYLGFLSAAVESYQYTQRSGMEGENTGLVPLWLVEWADENYTEIQCVQCEITDETGSPLSELIEVNA